MNILVSWSTAYDHIMDFNDHFKNHIQADKVHELSVSFLIDNLRKEIWGTGLNIAYNLAILWEKPILLTSVWKDFVFNEQALENINLEYINKSKELFTASWYITNDAGENQITAFYPGAMNEADKSLLKEIKEELKYAIISPNKKEAMLKHLWQMKDKWVETFFDPGQALFVFNKDDLEKASSLANYLIVNDYEYWKFKETIQWNDEKILESFDKIIITYWHKWSKILSKDNKTIEITPVTNNNPIDPTWAWDSYRAWLLRWLQIGYNWEKSWKIWSLISSISVWYYWWQNHSIDKKDFEELFKKEFWEGINL